MNTKYLDKEIELLNFIKRNNEISDYGQEKLNEFIAIKKQLLLHNVSQRSELLTFLEEVASDDRLMSSARIRERAAELLKVNCG